MLTQLADVSVRSLLLAGSAALVLWLMRRKRTAALEHAVWTAVVCGMLVLFAFGQALPRIPVRIPGRATISSVAAPMDVAFDAPTTAIAVSVPASVPAPAARPFDWMTAALYVYIATAFGFFAQFIIGMFLVRRLLSSARSVEPGIYESEIITVPVTVGCLRPRIILPSEWRGWDSEKLNAVLAHEGAHVRRRDGLVAAVAHVNRCIFWFHPMAWMLERRLALLAEQACDESSVALLGDCQRYAHLLLEMAGVVDGSHRRLRRHALTMASSSHIRQRIEALLQEGRAFSRGLTWTGWAAILLCGIPVVLCAGAIELDRQATSPSVARASRRAPVQAPVLLAQAEPTPSAAAPVPAVRPQFEVASIRPAAPRAPSTGGRARSGGTGVGTGCGAQRLSMDGSLVTYRCVPLQALIAFAFGIPQHDVTGPAWLMDTSPGLRFDVEAKMPTGTSKAQVPQMFRSLLEDRFQLAVHHGSQEQAVSALVVDKGGLKLKEASPDSPDPAVDPNLPPCPPASQTCSAHITNSDGEQVAMTPLSPGVQRFVSDRIGTALVMHSPEGKSRIDAPGTTLGGLAELLQSWSFQPVVDRTGTKGRYQVLIETFVDKDAMMAQARALATAAQAGGGPTNSAANAEVDAAFDRAISDTDAAGMRALQNALEKIGLRLETQKGQVEDLVVDHVEKMPTGN